MVSAVEVLEKHPAVVFEASLGSLEGNRDLKANCFRNWREDSSSSGAATLTRQTKAVFALP